MGSVPSAIGDAIVASFNKSCEDKCGDWNGFCYITNLCGASLFRMFNASLLALIWVMFLYLVLLKTGLVQFLVKCSCKLSWKACKGCFCAPWVACGCLWHKLRNTRRERRDVEMGDMSDTDESGSISIRNRMRGKSLESARERGKDRLQQALRLRDKKILKVEHRAAKRNRTEWIPHHDCHHHRATRLRTEASSSQYVHGWMVEHHPHHATRLRRTEASSSQYAHGSMVDHHATRQRRSETSSSQYAHGWMVDQHGRVYGAGAPRR